jgi:glutamate dehydrogenase
MAEIARAHAASWQLFSTDDSWAAIDGLAGAVGPALRTSLRLEGRRLAERATRWMLRHERAPIDVDATIASIRPGLTVLAEQWDQLISPTDRERFAEARKRYVDAGVPDAIAVMAARNRTFVRALEIVDVARETDRTPLDVAHDYFALDEALSIALVVDMVDALPRDDEWQSRARLALRDDLLATHRQLTQLALANGGPDALLDRTRAAVQRWHDVIARLPAGKATLDQLSVVVRELRRLTAA